MTPRTCAALVTRRHITWASATTRLAALAAAVTVWMCSSTGDIRSSRYGQYPTKEGSQSAPLFFGLALVASVLHTSSLLWLFLAVKYLRCSRTTLLIHFREDRYV